MKEKKLVTVSVKYKNTILTKFVRVEMVNGKAVVPLSVLTDMAKELGCPERGGTFTIG